MSRKDSVVAGPFSRILVAVDASPASENAARLAISFAQDEGVDLVFCHAIDVNRMLVQADRCFDDVPLALSAARAAAQDVLDRCCTLAREAGVFARSHTRDGKPAEEVARLADALGADLVVIGNHPGAKLRRVLCGSVRDEIVRASTLPVLAVDEDPERPPDFRPLCILTPVDDSPGSVGAVRLATEIARRYAARLVPVDVARLRAGAWIRAIDRAVIEHRPSMIVLGAAPVRGLRDPFASNVVERLLQESHVPLLVVQG